MKKVIISLLAAAAALSASADVTLFKAQGAPMCRYDGNADQIVEMYSGFSFRFPSEVKQRHETGLASHFIEKSAVGDQVELWGRHLDGINTISCEHILAGSLRWYSDRTLCFTPAAGTTITQIRMKLNTAPATMPRVSVVGEEDKAFKEYKQLSYNAADSTLTLTGSYTEPVFIMNVGEQHGSANVVLRPIFFEVTTTGTSTQCAVPEYSINRPMIAANEKLELTCPTPGAKIYYTIDKVGNWSGTAITGALRTYDPNPGAAGTFEYTAPIELPEDAIVRAMAVKEGMTNSFITYKEYYAMPEYTHMAVFDFMDHTSIKDEDGNRIAEFATYPVVNTAVSTSTVEKASIVENPAVCNDVTVTGTITNTTTGEGCDIVLSNTFGGVVELRPLNNASIYIDVPDDMYLSAVMMEGSQTEAIELDDNVPGTYKSGFVTRSQHIWTYDGDDVNEVQLNVKAGSEYVDRFYVFYTNNNPASGLNTVEVDANAPVEYFNLQGVRVANPANGIFIRRQGAKVSKVIL